MPQESRLVISVDSRSAEDKSADLQKALEFLAKAHTRFPLADMVSQSYRLEDAGAIFAQGFRPGTLRLAVRPE